MVVVVGGVHCGGVGTTLSSRTAAGSAERQLPDLSKWLALITK